MNNLLLIFTSLVFLFSHHLCSKGTIILLNGPSAAGKSSIQSEIQKQFDEMYLKVGIDTFFDALLPIPDLSEFEKNGFFAQYTPQSELIRSVELKRDTKGHRIVPLIIGPSGDLVISGMHKAIASYAEAGNNIAIDYILYKTEWIPDLIDALKNQKVYLIGIKAPLELLEEREKKRGTSPVGHARSHFDIVHQGMIYDLELDVSTLTPAESALKIKAFIENNEPSAINTLLKQIPPSNSP